MNSERGSMLIQVGILLVVLMAFVGFVADQGLLFVGRRQAQNAADAGAHAGVVALAFDDPLWRDPETSAYSFASIHRIVGEPAAVDVWLYSEAPGKFPAECADNSCVRVDVFRNQEHGNAVQTWFMHILGITEQGVRATATARVIDPLNQKVALIR